MQPLEPISTPNYQPIQEATKNLKRALQEAVSAVMAPVPDIKPSEWTERFRVIGPAAATPGPWKNDQCPWLVEMLDNFISPDCTSITFFKPTQVGGTELLLNCIGYTAHLWPRNILLVQPKIGAARKFGKERVEPLFLDSPVLRPLYNRKDPVDAKTLPGGATLWLVGANVPADLASRSVPYVFADEVDRYELAAGEEGDPIMQTIRRLARHPETKMLLTSSPSTTEQTRIALFYQESSQGKWEVPCPHCHEYQQLLFENFIIPHTSGETTPDDAYFACIECGAEIREEDKWKMQQAGRWKHLYPDRKEKGYWMTGFNSLAVKSTWISLAKEWLVAAKHAKTGNKEFLKQFTNSILAEVWKEIAVKITEHALSSHVFSYNRDELYAPWDVPEGPRILVAGVDVHQRNVQIAVWGVGQRERMWLIDHQVFDISPMTDLCWQKISDVLNRQYLRFNGKTMPIRCCAIDSGYAGPEKDASAKEKVYRFVQGFQSRTTTVIAVKGVTDRNTDILKRPAKSVNGDFKPYTVSVDSAKDLIFARLAPNFPEGPGFIYLPKWLPEASLKEFLAEEQREKRVRGVITGFEYHKKGSRNEQLDLLVYAMAAVRYWPGGIAKLDIDPVAESDPVPISEETSQATVEAPQPTYHIPKPKPQKTKSGITFIPARNMGYNRFTR